MTGCSWTSEKQGLLQEPRFGHMMKSLVTVQGVGRQENFSW